MRFYTYARKYGNEIFVRGYDDLKGGHFTERVPFRPTLYLPSKTPTEYKTLDGRYVSPIQPGSLKESRDFIEQYKGVSGTTIYGMERFVYQFLSEHYSGEIEYDVNKIKMWSLDIETTSENGFPKPDEAVEEVLLISLKNFNTKQIITFGSRPWKPTRDDVNYVLCDSEYNLLSTFLDWWEATGPEVITGWNVDCFDMTYLCTRIAKVLGDKYQRRMSPLGFVRPHEFEKYGKVQLNYEVMGVTILDYLDLYKKFTYTNRESYRLDVIANIELGQKKLDHSEYETFKEFYTNGWNKFVDYNLVDVDLVDRLEEKMKLIDLVMLMAYDAKCNYSDCFAMVRLWDVIIYNYLKEKNIVLSPIERSDKTDKYAGAYVKEPIPGSYDWVVSFDLNSLYPSLIRFLNISPETLLEHKHDRIAGQPVDKLINKETDVQGTTCSDIAVAANGAMYSKDQVGFMPELVTTIYEERKRYKKTMLEKKQKLVNIEEEMKRRGLL